MSSRRAGAPPEGGVFAIHCSDSRFQPHFQDFLRGQLGLAHYALLAVPGGPQFLTLSDYLPKYSWAGWRWVKFMMDVGNPQRVILIAHEDCRWYLDMRFGAPPRDLHEKQLADLRAVRTSLAERFGQCAVELYYGRLDNGRAKFERI